MRYPPLNPRHGRGGVLAGARAAALPPLVAVAHGSRDPRASATVEALVAEVRLARPEIPVVAAYLDHSRPTLAEALERVDENVLPRVFADSAGRVEETAFARPVSAHVDDVDHPTRLDDLACHAVVLPLLLTEAYHSRVDIPAVVAEARAGRPGLRVRQAATLGPHPLLITALERRLAEAGVPIGDPETAVVLVSAGSSDARANEVIAGMARDWARSRGWHSVVPAYASAASPTPEQAVRRALEGCERVVVAPYLLAPGYFADKVRGNTLEAGAHTVAAPLGPAPELVTVLLERYAEATAEPFARRPVLSGA
ncbi:sirohydrochlorin chelatase [Sphaerisporangium fuscum]|uniref:sirohydrochlorin chelatase n=1 Tax=Sphaerisporangium fuscum TaxID=2835868 RepID=UPI001BDD988B|nr:sirohydrochlorin chelatase [Sphaerisporangium fuscum]